MSNLKRIAYPLIALTFLVLTFLVHWGFIIVAIAITFWNHKQLMQGK